MANEHKIDINKRESLGKKGVKQLRREGMIPGIYYSPNSESSTPIVISQGDFHEAVKSGARIFNISVGEKKQNVLFKSVQYHPVTDDILHIDLYGVKMDEKITVKVSIHLTGDATGVKEEGGVLNSPTSEIDIACFPMDIIGAIEVDVTKLSIGDSMQVGDIKLDDKLTLMSSPDAVVASVTHAMREEEPVVEEEGENLFMDGEGGEAAEEAGDEEGEDPGGVFLGEVAEDAADEEAAEEVAGEDAEGEFVERGLESEFLNARGKAPAGEGAESAAEEDEQCLH